VLNHVQFENVVLVQNTHQKELIKKNGTLIFKMEHSSKWNTHIKRNTHQNGTLIKNGTLILIGTKRNAHHGIGTFN